MASDFERQAMASEGTSTNSGINTSGEGSRPTTSAGVDNIGAADAFTPSSTPDGVNAAPKSKEKMEEKKQDSSASRADEDAPWNSD
jgi:hypothetical protein